MSALAARRAAQAAKAAVSASTPVVVESHLKTTVVREVSPTLSALSSGESEDEAGPSKRRKTGKKHTRYFAPEFDDQEDHSSKDRRQTRGNKRNRRFSPSAPASDADEGVDSSDESSAEQEVSEGRADWTVPSAPRLDPRQTATIKSATPTSVSRFKANQGVNFQYLSEDDLLDAGLGGEGNGVILSLTKLDSVMLAGIYTIQPLQGNIDLLSTTLSPSSTAIPVFAPSSHPIPVITPSHSDRRNLPSALFSKLPLSSGFQLGESRTVLLVREYDCGMQGLKGGIVPGFSSIWGEDKGVWGLKAVHPVMSSNTTLYPHVTPESWVQPLRQLSMQDRDDSDTDEDDEEPPIALIKGPKRSGKSTFARAALNNLLNRYSRVAWLECDLGQGEFSPGGAVGLWIIDQDVLGPPFTHHRIPEKAHYLGSFTPQTCPDEYIAAIQQLLVFYRYEVAHPLLASSTTSRRGKMSSVVPLVINTQGWVKGLGEALLRSIELAASPTQTFTFEVDDPPAEPHMNGWTTSPPPFTASLSLESKVVTLQSPPVSPLLARHTPSDLRTLSLIAYFHAHLRDHTTWDFTRPLLAIPPWQVSLSTNPESSSAGLRRVVMMGESADSIDPSDIPLALNGNIVALVEDNAIPDGSTNNQPGLDDSTYLGLALVRAIRVISTGEYSLHILTPLPVETLRRANTIVRNGAVELPLCGMLDWRYPNATDLAGVRWEDVPFLDVSGVVGVGGERRRFRRNLMRKGQ